MKLDNKRVLVAGGAGFVGSHLVDALLEKNCRVCVIDNLERGKLQNLFHCLDKIEFFTSDLSEPVRLLGQVDVVFDFAAKVFGVRDLYVRPADMLTKNLLTTFNVLKMSSNLGIEKYVFASSSCVYDFEGCPIPHVENVMNLPNTEYGLSKIVGEHAVKAYSEQYEFQYGIARIFNVYGPRESPMSPHVIPDFTRKAWKCSKGEKKFEILGDGKQTRAFVYVSDTVKGLIRIAEDLTNDVVNLGSEEEICMNDLASKILSLFNTSQVEIVNAPVHAKDIRRRSGSTKKANELLGWKPTINLDTGLRLFKEWMMPLLEEDRWK